MRRPRGSEPYLAILNAGVERRGECLLYKGKVGKNGYASIGSYGKGEGAHRVSYRKWHGPIPDGFHVDHVCHNEAASRGECDGRNCYHRRCVNPAHLRAVSPRENWGASPLTQALLGKWQRARTECPQGHPYNDANTRIDKHGHRYCRQCQSDRARARSVAADPLWGTRENHLKTHCPHGHEYSSENTYVHRGRRICRTCVRDRNREAAREKRRNANQLPG